MRSLMIFVFMAGIMLVLITGITFEEGLSQDSDWAIALHGGAGVISKDMPDSARRKYQEALELALEIGEEILENGGTSMDAVEQVVRYLEDHPSFNAGKGSVFTREGAHELDASIMDGSTLEAGALTGLTTVKNPISLARKVLLESRHIFFSGEGAEQFADEMGVERVKNDWFSTPRRYEQWQRTQENKSSLLKPGEVEVEGEVSDAPYGTVGAVALDMHGNLAAGTSTGGMTHKKFGRVGDVPIIGAGTYANDLVAVSATGWGEQIMRHVSAHTIAAYLEFNKSTLDDAMDFVLNERLRPGEAGFIAVDHRGNVSMKMNTNGMFRAGANASGYRKVAIWKE
ncbi:MAG: isoaspartyl peptidase/L-asparaginase [Balneolaceae bacterium]